MKKYTLFPLMLLSITTFAQRIQSDTTFVKELSEVTVTAYRNDYKIDTSISISKMPMKDMKNPQVYNTISKNILKDQLVTNLHDALKNATGITRLWESTGRGGDGAEFYSMRGFALQPTMMNGMPNISNGTVDPANIESIEVIKGPSGTLYGGSLIAYGGLINIVSKKPYERFGGEIGYISGSYGLNRFTADINIPLDDKIFARLNVANQYVKSFQDAGFNKVFYLAPSIKINASKKLTFLFNTEFKNAEAANAPMIFLTRYAALSFKTMDLFENSYEKSYTANSLSMKNPSFSIQSQALYKLSNNWTSQTILSRSHTKTNGYYQYLWDSSNGNEFTRFISKRDGETNTVDIQQNFVGHFNLGTFKNNVLLGIDYLNSQVENYSTGWVPNGIVSLVNQSDNGKLTTQGTDQLLINSAEGNSIAETKILSAYVSDVIHFTPKFSAMLSLRIDNFQGNPSIWSSDQLTSQTTFSPKFGIVYQPILNKVSIFGNYMNGFKNLSPVEVADVNGNNPSLKILTPEHANQWEVGVKTNLYKDKIALTASYYNILVSNKSMSDPNNINNTIQGGEVESKGFELSMVTSPIEGLSIITGFSHNENEVKKDTPNGGYLGLRTEEAGPANLFNFWAIYRVQKSTLKGISFGLGANYASEFNTLNRANIGSFTLPSYTIFNASLAYTINQYSINLKVDNLANTKYYAGWSTVTPQRLRSISLGFNYKF
ncbi:TonB-dependent siderophore receptor [Aquirufa ecclesiirivi]|uniref:TonB-dependent siderophore receptor n=1 Tax=Aquirufa ecclesiirivi TaxID=2715124 RepID=UPI003BAE1FD3